MRGGKELCTRSTNSTCCPHALLGVSVGKFHTRWRRSVLFACGLMCIFPAISARKGADERKVGFFSKYRNAAEVHAELSETARSRTDCPRLSLRACSNRREFFGPTDSASPLDSAAAIRAEPQFQEHRRTRTVAESPRLPLPQVCLRRIAEPHTYGRGRLRRETAGEIPQNRLWAVFRYGFPNYG